jgi:hypothetical protein
MASSKSRGAMWELTSGERKLFVRGFRGALVADNGEAVGEFPKIETANHSLVLMNPSTNTLNTLREISDRGASQYGQFLLLRKSLVNTAKNENKTATGFPNPVESQDAAEPSLDRQVRFEVHNFIQNKLIWSRDFPKDAPGFEFNEFSGRLIFHWSLRSETGKARLAADAALARRAKELGNKDDDFLVEIVDTFLGKTIGSVLLETGQGSFDIKSSLSEGDWFILHDSENRILVYSMKEGKLRHRFFGENAAVNPAKNQIVIQNYPGELIFYDLESGDAQGRLTLSSGATFLRFSLEGNKLFVLSREQTAYAFDLEKVISTSAPIPN